jgi:phage tail tape-measure protein
MSYAQLMMDHVQLAHKHVMLRADIHHLAADLRDLLSFIDEETKDTGYQEATEKASGNGSMSRIPPVEHGPLPDVCPFCYA